jgi:hypothetical protein
MFLMINFLAELSSRLRIIILPTPSNEVKRSKNIYQLDISETPEESYWTEWGGVYNNYVDNYIELYFSRFLTQVGSLDEVLNAPFTFCLVSQDTDIDGGNASDTDETYLETYDCEDAMSIITSILDGGEADNSQVKDKMVYLNVPKHTWLYADWEVEGEVVNTFLYSALDPNRPSNNTLKGKPAKVRLELPSFSVKLSENINGITLNQGFNVSLHNNDGHFDDETNWDIFNTPLHLKKCTKPNPIYYDFKLVRTGLVDDTQTDFKSFKVNASDRFRTLNEPVCNTIKIENYPFLTLADDAIGKNIPVIYGTKDIKLQKLDDANHYIAAEYITSIQGVYDNDGNSISYTYSSQTNVITVTQVDEDGKYIKADMATITGRTTNTIGEIIKDLIIRKTNVAYINTYWNIPEMNKYIAISPRINITFSSGDVKSAVQNILKSDMAYFIQQSDNKFTIRKYGQTYNVHTIQNWTITKELQKNYAKAEKNFFSSCTINYNYRNDTNETFVYAMEDHDAEDKYRKKISKEFNTDLIYFDDVYALAKLLGERYITMRQVITLPVGIDTSSMELLDRVHVELKINNRLFSQATNYIITEINPVQDILTLEEI